MVLQISAVQFAMLMLNVTPEFLLSISVAQVH